MPTNMNTANKKNLRWKNVNYVITTIRGIDVGLIQLVMQQKIEGIPSNMQSIE